MADQHSPSAQWSALPRELLGMILERLDLADHARFSTVCSWRNTVASETPLTNKALGLVLSGDPDRLVRRFLTSFRPSWAEARFVGCFERWLVAVIDGMEMLLLDVASREEIPLPPPPDRQDFAGTAVLSSPPPSGGDCTIVLNRADGSLAFCRLGDRSFKPFYEPQRTDGLIRGIAFHKGLLYAIDKSYTLKVFVSGLDSDPIELAPRLPSGYVWCLVGSGDKLLAVGWAIRRRSPRLKVLEFDLVCSGWIEVESLGNKALLLDYATGSQALWAEHHREELRPNHVYCSQPSSLGGEVELGSFSLSDKVYQESYHCSRRKPVFFNLFHPDGFRKS